MCHAKEVSKSKQPSLLLPSPKTEAIDTKYLQLTRYAILYQASNQSLQTKI